MSLFNQWIRHRTTRKYFVSSIRTLRLSPPSFAKTHYQTLGLSNGASQADIKRAYYDLSMTYHPDKDKGSEEKFRDITTAYEVLGNPRLRRLYDRGLLSDEQPDASIHYPTEPSDGPTGYSEQDKEKVRVSVKTFDQWSQEHYSETFQRNQYDRNTQKKRENAKGRISSTSSENGVYVFLFVLLVSLVYFVTDTKKRERRGDKKS